MTFTSFQFVVFFPFVILLFYLLPARFRWVLLLAASAFSYWVFSWQCLMLLFGMNLLNYFVGIWIINNDHLNIAGTEKFSRILDRDFVSIICSH